jgi:peptide/nickel transport system permease protein
MNAFRNYARRIIFEAKTALEQNDLPKARILVNRALRLDPGLVDGWLILAAISEPAESIQFLEKAIAIDPDHPKAKQGFVWARKQLAESGMTRQEIEELISSSPLSSQVMESEMQTENILEIDLDFSPVEDTKTRKPLRWQTVLVSVCISLIILVAAFAPIIAPVEEGQASRYFKDICERIHCLPEPPDQKFILGTIKDFDVFHTLVWGTREALGFGFSSALLTALFGTLLGTISAFSGGILDQAIMRSCDALLAFPLIAAVALFAQVIALLSPTSYGMTVAQFDAIPEELNLFQSLLMNSDPVFLAFVLFSWMPYARVMHAQVLRIKQSEFVNAARVLGARNERIVARHIIPNAISPCIVTAARDVGRMVVLQASFTFIGVGSSSSWSTLLNIGKDWIIGPGGNLITRWWIYLPITLAILFFGTSWSLLGDEINHALNPKNA